MKRRIKLAMAAVAMGVSAQALAQAAQRTVLPVPAAPFDGALAENVLDARPATPHPVRAPQGAPNVFVMMSDDVGFSMSGTFGGPVPDRPPLSGPR